MGQDQLNLQSFAVLCASFKVYCEALEKTEVELDTKIEWIKTMHERLFNPSDITVVKS